MTVVLDLEAAVLDLVEARRSRSMQSERVEDGEPERGVSSALEKEARRSCGETGAEEVGEKEKQTEEGDGS